MFKYLNKDAPFRMKIFSVMVTLQAWFVAMFLLDICCWEYQWENKITFWSMAVLSLGGMCVFGICWYWLNRLITSPVERLTALGGSILKGHPVEVDLPDISTRKDCTGQLYSVISEFAHSLQKNHQVIEHLGEVLKELSNCNLLVKLDSKVFEGEFSVLRDAFNNSIEHLNNAMCVISHNSNMIATGTKEISEAADELSKRSEIQANEISGVTESIKNMSKGVVGNANSCEEADKEAEASLGYITEVTSLMKSTSTAMDVIRKGSDSVSEIISVIDHLAFQTNVLALNAGVEAARAGDAGKGFAVVAQEVRVLAEQSAKSANDIRKLVMKSSAQVAQGVKLVASTNSYLEEFKSSLKRVVQRISGIAEATKEQSERVSTIADSISNMDHVTKQNAAMVEQTSTASHNLKNETKTLSQTLAHFKTGSFDAHALSHNDNKQQDGVIALGHDVVSDSQEQVGTSSGQKPQFESLKNVKVKGINGREYPVVSSDEGWQHF